MINILKVWRPSLVSGGAHGRHNSYANFNSLDNLDFLTTRKCSGLSNNVCEKVSALEKKKRLKKDRVFSYFFRILTSVSLRPVFSEAGAFPLVTSDKRKPSVGDQVNYCGMISARYQVFTTSFRPTPPRAHHTATSFVVPTCLPCKYQ